jgi:hypothetical protein
LFYQHSQDMCMMTGYELPNKHYLPPATCDPSASHRPFTQLHPSPSDTQRAPQVPSLRTHPHPSLPPRLPKPMPTPPLTQRPQPLRGPLIPRIRIRLLHGTILQIRPIIFLQQPLIQRPRQPSRTPLLRVFRLRGLKAIPAVFLRGLVAFLLFVAHEARGGSRVEDETRV